MNKNLDIYIYMDEGLIKGITSILLNGYTDIKKFSKTKDTTSVGQLRLINRDANKEQYDCTKNKNDGYKSVSNKNDQSYERSKENNTSLENREYDRYSEEITRITTTALFNNDMIRELIKINGLKTLSKGYQLKDVKEGDIIEVIGQVCDISLISYVQTLIDVITWYGVEKLNSLIVSQNNALLDYSTILNMLKSILEILTRNGTQDFIFKGNNIPINLIINRDYFLDNKSYMYDFINCKCKIIGKVINVNQNDDELCLFRKSCEKKFYEKLFEQIDPYLKILKDNDIILPEKCCVKILGKAINILPISICI